MAQTFLIANLSKREYFRPERMGPGASFREFAFEGSAFQALGFLLSYSTDRHPMDPDWERESAGRFFGHWAGDAVVIIGDFFLPSLAPNPQHKALPTFSEVEQDYLDIGSHLVKAWNDMEPGLANRMKDMTQVAPPASPELAAKFLRERPELAEKVTPSMAVQVLAPGLAEVAASGGGGSYEVELRMVMEPAGATLRATCTCPQGRIRKECKHMAAFAAFLVKN